MQMEKMDTGCGFSYFDPDFDLSECIHPIRVCFDNETCEDYTIVKVDCANKHGILLEMVQALTDLDLIISKSYISSDGGWLMDVFHVSDHHGHKLIDPSLIQYIEQSLNFAQKQKGSSTLAQDKICPMSLISTNHLNSNCSTLEITTIDHPGLFSEVTAVLFELSCDMEFGKVWTYNGRAAFILNIIEQSTGQPIFDPIRLRYVEEQVMSVVKAHNFPSELWRVRLLSPTTHQIHIERRLHQLMQENKDYEAKLQLSPIKVDHSSLATVAMEDKRRVGYNNGENREVCEPYVSVESWKEMDYLVVNVRSRDRPKLLFDTVCALTNLDYDVFHASISSHGSIAIQEYYVRRMDGCMMNNEMEKQNVAQCLVAALERRVPHGSKIELRTLYRHGLLLDVIQAFRENDLSIAKAKFVKQENLVIGTFYIINASSSIDERDIDQQRLEAVCNNIGKGVIFDRKKDYNHDEEYYGYRVDWPRPNIHLNNIKWTSLLFHWRWHGHSIFKSLRSILWSYIEQICDNFSFTQS